MKWVYDAMVYVYLHTTNKEWQSWQMIITINDDTDNNLDNDNNSWY